MKKLIIIMLVIEIAVLIGIFVYINTHNKYDLNRDGKVDLTDVSIVAHYAHR